MLEWSHLLQQRPPLQALSSLFANTVNTDVQVLRLDQIDELLSGNKSYKLALNIEQARQQGFKQLLSFGGAYSNHIHALAAAGQSLGLRTIGVIRGEPHYASNPCLTDAQSMGMQLHFVDRRTYKQRYEADFHQQLQQQFGASYIIPEGGANELGALGCQAIAQQLKLLYPDGCRVWLAAGTATTAAGIASALDCHSQVKAVDVVSQAKSRSDEMQARLKALLKHLGGAATANKLADLDCVQSHSYGGYAKYTPGLVALIDFAWQQWQLPLEPVYTAKAFSALLDSGLSRDLHTEIESKPPEVFIHTGGLQGLRGCQPIMDKYRLKPEYQQVLSDYQKRLTGKRNTS